VGGSGRLLEGSAQTVNELGAAGAAPLRILGERAREDTVDLGRQGGIHLVGGRHGRRHVSRRLGGGRIALERPSSRQQLESDDPEGVAVARRRRALPLRLL